MYILQSIIGNLNSCSRGFKQNPNGGPCIPWKKLAHKHEEECNGHLAYSHYVSCHYPDEAKMKFPIWYQQVFNENGRAITYTE